MHTFEELKELQSLPLKEKIKLTQKRITEWVDHYSVEGVYVSFSGGKDSTVLLDIARKLYPEIKAVFVDTGLEYPEIRDFVKSYENVDWLKPKMNFRQVIEKYGYPFISKEVSNKVAGGRRYLRSVSEGGAENSLPMLHGRPAWDRQTFEQEQRRLLEAEEGSYP